MNQLRAAATEASGQLDTDLASLAARGAADGDLPVGFVCGLALASMAGGIVTVWLPPHAPGAAAIAAGATVWKTLRCREIVP